MTAGTRGYVRCDGTVETDRTDSGRMSCPEMVEGGQQPDGSWEWPTTQAEARKLARARGWFHVRYPRSRASLAWDFCAAHEDQARERAEKFGVKLARPKPKQDPDRKPQEG